MTSTSWSNLVIKKDTDLRHRLGRDELAAPGPSSEAMPPAEWCRPEASTPTSWVCRPGTGCGVSHFRVTADRPVPKGGGQLSSARTCRWAGHTHAGKVLLLAFGARPGSKTSPLDLRTVPQAFFVATIPRIHRLGSLCAVTPVRCDPTGCLGRLARFLVDRQTVALVEPFRALVAFIGRIRHESAPNFARRPEPAGTLLTGVP